MSTSELHPLVPSGRFISLAEVAKITGWSLRSLTEDCRAKRIEHMYRRGTYSLTPEQFDVLLTDCMVAAAPGPRTATQREVDELEYARQANAERSVRRGKPAA